MGMFKISLDGTDDVCEVLESHLRVYPRYPWMVLKMPEASFVLIQGYLLDICG
jgi:hypothetical protein